MKKLFLMLFFIKIQLLQAQKSIDASIKVYVQDAETAVIIKDAQVRLEGFQIKSIKAKFNKRGNYYYFDSIPKGYNTITAHHKNYNEKGYQNPGGLPPEIRLKLYNPYQIRMIGDSLNYFREDNEKIVIDFTQKFEDSIKMRTENDTVTIIKYFQKHHPGLKVVFKDRYGLFKRFCYAIKSNRNPFERFNDTALKKLSDDKNIAAISGLLLKTVVNDPKNKIHKVYFDKKGKPNYLYSHIKTFQDGKLVSEYSLKKSQLDSLYRIEEKKYHKQQFYEFEAISDTLVQRFNNSPYMPTSEVHHIPYIMISNTMTKEEIKEEEKKDSNVLYSFTYKLVNPDKEKKNLGSPYNLEQINGYPIRYKTKYLICSPFGLSDVLEIDNKSLLKQELINTIYKN